MADFNLQPVGTQIKPVQGMSLADMVNLARGVQEYQQAQQINPVQLEAARQTLQTAQQAYGQAQQLNPIAVQQAAANLARTQQLTPEEIKRAAAEARRSEAEATVSEKTQEPRITRSEAESKTAQAQQQAADLTLAQARLKGITDRLTAVYNNPLLQQAEKDPNSVKPGQLAALVNQYGKEQAAALGIPDDQAAALIYPYMKQAMENPQGLRRFLGEKLLATVDAAGRVTALQPTGVPVQYGSGGQVTQTGEFGPLKPGAALPGTAYTQGLGPFTGTTETGAPGVFKGTAGGVVNPPQGQPTAPAVSPGVRQPAAQPSGQVGAQPSGQVGGQAPSVGPRLGLFPGETYEAYRERVARTGKLPAMANTALNMSNPESVPNMEYTNDKILRLLEKKVDVGPIANAIANKTGGIGLSSEQQEIIKYLEQRIRQQATRTDQDQASIRSAFGSFGTNRDALMDIIYNDKGTLASQRLYYSGIRKYQGDPNKPNLAAVSQFENKFNEINQDPDVSHLLGVIGTKKTSQLTASDKQHLQKYFGGMSDDRIKDLFNKRDQLMKLVEGSQ